MSAREWYQSKSYFIVGAFFTSVLLFSGFSLYTSIPKTCKSPGLQKSIKGVIILSSLLFAINTGFALCESVCGTQPYIYNIHNNMPTLFILGYLALAGLLISCLSLLKKCDINSPANKGTFLVGVIVSSLMIGWSGFILKKNNSNTIEMNVPLLAKKKSDGKQRELKEERPQERERDYRQPIVYPRRSNPSGAPQQGGQERDYRQPIVYPRRSNPSGDPQQGGQERDYRQPIVYPHRSNPSGDPRKELLAEDLPQREYEYDERGENKLNENEDEQDVRTPYPSRRQQIQINTMPPMSRQGQELQQSLNDNISLVQETLGRGQQKRRKRSGER